MSLQVNLNFRKFADSENQTKSRDLFENSCTVLTRKTDRNKDKAGS